MDLFDQHELDPIELLPCDGSVLYYAAVVPFDVSRNYCHAFLQQAAWQNDRIKVADREVVAQRQVALYGDWLHQYEYSGVKRQASPWLSPLFELKTLVESSTSAVFNSCLLNLYHNGKESMGWHCDNEQSLVKNAAIAIVSLGAERRLCFKHKREQHKVSVTLKAGSILLMSGATQSHWLHCVPKMAAVQDLRISATFRRMLGPV